MEEHKTLFGALATFAIAVLPGAGKLVKDWLTRRRERHSLPIRVEHNERSIREQADRLSRTDDEMRQYVLSQARKADERINQLETRLNETLELLEESRVREDRALGKVADLMTDLSIAQSQIRKLTDRVVELENINEQGLKRISELQSLYEAAVLQLSKMAQSQSGQTPESDG